MTGRTRGGTIFKKVEYKEGTMAQQSELTQMLKTLLDDRKVLEEELRRERQERAEESDRRHAEMTRQMDLLRGLVETERGRHEGGAERRVIVDPKVAKLADSEAYLVTFERLMGAYEVPRERWAFQLAPQLSGRAQHAYAALNSDDAADYDLVKQGILRRYDISSETYRQRFRSATMKPEETARELCVRLEDLTIKWTKDCDTIDKLRDAIILEQFVLTLPKDVKLWVQEHKPDSSEAAAKLADDYMQATLKQKRRKENL